MLHIPTVVIPAVDQHFCKLKKIIQIKPDAIKRLHSQHIALSNIYTPDKELAPAIGGSNKHD